MKGIYCYRDLNNHGKSSTGKQRYRIMRNGKTIKQSFYPSKLLEWFTKEFPKEILQIKINLED